MTRLALNRYAVAAAAGCIIALTDLPHYAQLALALLALNTALTITRWVTGDRADEMAE